MPPDYDFDRVIDRRHTGSSKWYKCETSDIIPMGIADMDFPSPPAVLNALQERLGHGVFGYTYPTEELIDTIRSALQVEYGWEIEEDWLVWLPGLVAGLNVVSRAAGKLGDEVLTSTPVYPPFLTSPINVRRKLSTVPLLQDNNHWSFDFDRIEAAITSRSKLFLLCNPHNPVGRVYTQDELETLGEICIRHDLWVCSDEIHCGLVLDPDKRHVPLATISSDIADRTITFMSPSKTFNLAGIGCAFAIISNDEIREAFMKAMKGLVPHVGPLGYAACLAAYRDGGEWREALLDYLRENRRLVYRSLAEIPQLSVSQIEATYLAWIDTRSAEIAHPGQFFEGAGVHLWDGIDFGGPGFARLNFACPRSRLQEGLTRIRTAFER